MELDAGRADAPAGAGAAEQSSNGPGVRTGGVGTNRGEVVDRGVHVGARVGCLAATWRRCSVSALLEAQAGVFRVSASSGGRRAAGADVLSARCRRLPLGVSSIGVGGWAERAARGGGAQARGVFAPAA